MILTTPDLTTTNELNGSVIMDIPKGMFSILNQLMPFVSLNTRKEELFHAHSILVHDWANGDIW